VVSAVFALSLLPAAVLYLATDHIPGDTTVMVQHVRDVLGLIGKGHWTGWGGAFPLLQQLESLPLVMAGLHDDTIYRSLVAVSALSLLGLAWWGGRSLGRRSRLVAGVFVAVVLAGPLVWYGHASFAEMLVALLTLGLVAALADGAGAPRVVLLMVAAAISKDTALPFLVLLALAAAWTASDAADPWHARLRLVPITVAAMVALVVVVGFNFIQFGAFSNTHYLTTTYIVPTIAIQVRFFIAIWLSPNGGVLPFWPAYGALLALALAAAARDIRAAAGRGRLDVALPSVLVVAVLFGLTFGFSKWDSPLGWISWGPRLLIPWLPAAVYLLLAAHASGAESLLGSLIRHRALAVGVVLALALVSLPQYVILFRPKLWDPLFAPDATCPRIPYIEQGADYYYRCTVHQLLTKHSVLLDAYQAHFDRTAFLLAAICAAAWAWFTATLAWRVAPVPRR
jgi:hypothetical protein